MKKLWNKIRKWLIKKLGAVEDTPIVPHKISVMQSDVIKICAEKIIPPNIGVCVVGHDWIWNDVRKEIAYQIGKEALDKGYIRFESRRSDLLMESTVRGTLLILDRREN